MPKKLAVAGAFLASSVFFAPAHAAVITAESNLLAISDFTIEFNDTNNNGLFDITELVSFSGFTVNSTVDLFDGTFTQIGAVPAIPGISAAGTSFFACTEVPDQEGNWCMLRENNSGNFFQPSVWDFVTTAVAPVPLPAGLPLFLTALGGLGLMVRRKRKAG